MLNPKHVAWCRQTFDTLNDSGVWGIPRSGLMFQKRGNKLVLIAQMPYDSAMPCTLEEFDAQQTRDYEGTKEHFAVLGITVERDIGGRT